MDPNTPETTAVAEKTDKIPLITYGLYIIGVVIPLLPLIGLIVAYIKRGESSAMVQTHYTFLIRTFWIGLLGSFIALLLSFVGIGFLLYIALVIWYLIRTIKGVLRLNDGKPIEDPQTWLF